MDKSIISLKVIFIKNHIDLSLKLNIYFRIKTFNLRSSNNE